MSRGVQDEHISGTTHCLFRTYPDIYDVCSSLVADEHVSNRVLDCSNKSFQD